MGNRSNNLLIIAASQIATMPADALKYLARSQVDKTDDAHAFIWETNFTPFRTRSGVFDLLEEVAILGWALKLPPGDFFMLRTGDDAGAHGVLDVASIEIKESIKETVAEYLKANSPEAQLDYMMLGRLQRDCEYYLGMGNRAKKHLWAGDEAAQIKEMRLIFNRLPVAPVWISEADIARYEAAMVGAGASAQANSSAEPAMAVSREALQKERDCALQEQYGIYDFGYEVVDDDNWAYSSPGDVYTQTVYLKTADDDEMGSTTKATLTVVFHPGTAEVAEVYATLDNGTRFGKPGQP